MDNTPTSLPPRPAALKKAQAWIDTKRGQVNHQYQGQQAMLDSIGEMLGGFGIKGMVIGDEHFSFGEEEPASRALENKWTQQLAQGAWVAVLQVDTMGTSYYGDEKVRLHDRALNELIDVDQVRALAPNAEIFDAKQVSPWPNVLDKDGFQIWANDRNEFEQLWAHLPQWMKTDWHDEALKNCKYPRKAKDVFTIRTYHDIAPDLGWREAQYLKAQAQFDKSSDMLQWDSLAQQELKKAIGSLISLEGHPVFGGLVQGWIDQLTPLLAQSMDGKEQVKKLQASQNAARVKLYEGFKTHCLDLNKWTTKAPTR